MNRPYVRGHLTVYHIPIGTPCDGGALARDLLERRGWAKRTGVKGSKILVHFNVYRRRFFNGLTATALRIQKQLILT